jgi:DNA-binding Xre family transcriptional regulator
MKLNFDVLEAHRTVSRLDKKAFAKKIGVSHQCYYNWQNTGAPNIKLSTINMVAKKLRVHPNRLITTRRDH